VTLPGDHLQKYNVEATLQEEMVLPSVNDLNKRQREKSVVKFLYFNETCFIGFDKFDRVTFRSPSSK
jgi:hypothetical protein